MREIQQADEFSVFVVVVTKRPQEILSGAEAGTLNVLPFMQIRQRNVEQQIRAFASCISMGKNTQQIKLRYPAKIGGKNKGLQENKRSIPPS